jgi:hypothetical protein
MFTFYDNTYGFEEKVWNLCYNEKLDAFITFYSWVPSYMENINNIPFSFDRNTSKWISKLGISNSNSSFSEGILLSNNIITDSNGGNIGTLSLSPDLLPDNITGNLYIKYELIRDHFGNKDKFKLEETEGKWVLKLNDNIEYESLISEYYYRNKTGKAGPDDDKNKVTINDEGFSYDLPIFVNK